MRMVELIRCHQKRRFSIPRPDESTLDIGGLAEANLDRGQESLAFHKTHQKPRWRGAGRISNNRTSLRMVDLIRAQQKGKKVTPRPVKFCCLSCQFFLLRQRQWVRAAAAVHQVAWRDGVPGRCHNGNLQPDGYCRPAAGRCLGRPIRAQAILCAWVGAVGAGINRVCLLDPTGSLRFFILRLVQGIGYSAFYIANLILVSDMVPTSRRGEVIGLFGISGLITIALAPALGEHLIQAAGFPALFQAAAVAGVAVLLASLLCPVPRRTTPYHCRLVSLRSSHRFGSFRRFSCCWSSAWLSGRCLFSCRPMPRRSAFRRSVPSMSPIVQPLSTSAWCAADSLTVWGDD